MNWRSLLPGRQPEAQRLYRALVKAHDGSALQGPLDAARGSRYVVYSRGCGGGTSLLVREETADGACRAHAVLATYASDGIEESSFADPREALAFVTAAVTELVG